MCILYEYTMLMDLQYIFHYLYDWELTILLEGCKKRINSNFFTGWMLETKKIANYSTNSRMLGTTHNTNYSSQGFWKLLHKSL